MTLDSSEGRLGFLSSIQEIFLHRVLGLGKKAMTEILWSETGLWPVRYRRLLLALRFLKRVLSLDEPHLVRAATQASSSLSRAGTWYYVLTENARRLLGKQLPDFGNLTEAVIDDIIAAVRPSLVSLAKGEVESSSESYLLRQSVLSRQRRPVLQFRPTFSYKRPLTDGLSKVLCSDHSLAVECLRWYGVPREARLCRLCGDNVESPEHTIFTCAELPAHLMLRRMNLIAVLNQTFGMEALRGLPLMELLLGSLEHLGITTTPAAIAHSVVEHFQEFPHPFAPDTPDQDARNPYPSTICSLKCDCGYAWLNVTISGSSTRHIHWASLMPESQEGGTFVLPKPLTGLERGNCEVGYP